MKHLLLFIGLLMSSVSIQAQGDFAPVGAAWHNQNGYHDYLDGYTYYIVEQDTIYHDIACRKVSRYHVAPDGQNGVDTTVQDPLYIYSNPDTVYYYNALFEQFVPLYIFNVNEGMTLDFHMPFETDLMPPDSMFQVYIESVSSEIIDGMGLKKIRGNAINVDNYGLFPNYTYMEKLGLLDKQLVPVQESLLGDYFPGKLRCYQDDEIVYHREAAIPCDTIPGYTGISELAQQYKNLRLYPNPVQDDWLQLELDSAPGSVLQVQVYNINGARVATMESTGNTRAVRLYVGDLPPGIYQVQVNTEGKVVGKGKFVKR